MVVFTCNHCGESLHKPKVDKHYQFTCRNYKSVTCVDCFKDFRDEEYVAHIKCITEDERYSAKGTYKNGIVKKGEVKQESWVEMIKSICEMEKNLSPSVSTLLNTVAEYDNVPRKKQKFMNFIKSSSGNRANMKEVEQVWDIIEKYKAQKPSNNRNNLRATDAQKPEIEDNDLNKGTLESEKQSKKRLNSNDTEESLKKKQKKSLGETAEESSRNNERQKLEPFKGTKQIFAQENGNQLSKKSEKSKKKTKPAADIVLENSTSPELLENSTEFNFTQKILDVLAEKQNISLKKLQKKILKAYVSVAGQNDCEEKVIKKFNKKLKKIPNVGIEDDRVVLK